VQVGGYNVPVASQAYALAVAGPLSGTITAQYPIFLPIIQR